MSRLRSACVLLTLSAVALATNRALAAPVDQPLADTAPAANADQAPRYPFRGVILGIFPDKGTLLIKHEDVPGLMKGMKMAFRVADTSIFATAMTVAMPRPPRR